MVRLVALPSSSMQTNGGEYSSFLTPGTTTTQATDGSVPPVVDDSGSESDSGGSGSDSGGSGSGSGSGGSSSGGSDSGGDEEGGGYYE